MRMAARIRRLFEKFLTQAQDADRFKRGAGGALRFRRGVLFKICMYGFISYWVTAHGLVDDQGVGLQMHWRTALTQLEQD